MNLWRCSFIPKESHGAAAGVSGVDTQSILDFAFASAAISSASNLSGREAVDKAFLLAEVRTAVAGVVGRKHPFLRYEQPRGAIPCSPITVVVDIGAGRPAVGIVAARRARIKRRVPVLVDVVHLRVAIAVVAALREGLRSGRGQERCDDKAGNPAIDKGRLAQDWVQRSPRPTPPRGRLPVWPPMLVAKAINGQRQIYRHL